MTVRTLAAAAMILASLPATAAQFTCTFPKVAPMAFKYNGGDTATLRGKEWQTVEGRFRMFYRGNKAVIADRVVKIDGRIRSANAALIVNGKQTAAGICTMDTQADGRGEGI